MRPRKTILCVDDSEQVLSTRRFLLDIRGYRVLSATSGEDALNLLRQGGVDLVLTDLIMPNMDGNELVRRTREIDPEVRTMIVSGTIKTFDRASNADAFMPKGTPAELMLERVRVLVARKRGPKKQPKSVGLVEANMEGAA